MVLFKLKNVKYKNIIKYPDLEIKAGITTFITGESGVGKSTLLKLLNGVLTPTDGNVWLVDEKVLNIDSIELRRKVLLVGQSAFLFDEQSIRENFRMFFNYRDEILPCDDEIKAFLTICSIEMSLDGCVYELSGGEKQRVFIAIHLALGFEVLMMDEPTSALDEKNGSALLANIKSYCKENKKSLIIISHNREAVEHFADDIIVLGDEGKCQKF